MSFLPCRAIQIHSFKARWLRLCRWPLLIVASDWKAFKKKITSQRKRKIGNLTKKNIESFQNDSILKPFTTWHFGTKGQYIWKYFVEYLEKKLISKNSYFNWCTHQFLLALLMCIWKYFVKYLDKEWIIKNHKNPYLIFSFFINILC